MLKQDDLFGQGLCSGGESEQILVKALALEVLGTKIDFKMESGYFLETQKVDFIIHSGYIVQWKFNKCTQMDETKWKVETFPRQKHIEYI